MALSPAMKSLAEANSAAVGGGVATTLLYPLDVLKTKLATAKDGENLSTIGAIKKILKEDGILGFYQGVHFKAVQSTLQKFLYFYGYSFLQGLYERNFGKMNTQANLIIAYTSELLCIPVSMPLETIVTQFQTSKNESLSTIIQNISSKGFLGFYRGYQTYPYVSLQPAIQYTIFEQLKRFVLLKRNSGSGTNAIVLSALDAFVIGAIARAIALILTYPYTKAKTLMQAERGKSSNTETSNQSITSFLISIAKRDGFLTLFNGLTPELARGVLSSAFMLMVKEKIYLYNVGLLLKFLSTKKDVVPK